MKRFFVRLSVCALGLAGMCVHAMPLGIRTLMHGRAAVRQVVESMWIVTFDANGGEGGTSVVQHYGTEIVAPTVTRTGYTFVGWLPEVDKTVPASNVTYVAYWTEIAAPDPEPDAELDPEPAIAQQVWTVSFDAQGGSLGTTRPTIVTNGCAVGELPTPTLSGYTFDGWFTEPDVGSRVSEGTIIKTNVTFYAHWTEIPQPPPPDSGELDTAFAKAQTVDGALYKGDALVGTVQVKVGKISKKGVIKVSATATLIVKGAVKKVTAKAVNVNVREAMGSTDATERVPPTKVVFKEPIGEMTFEMESDGTFTLKNGSYLMAEAKIGGALNGGSYGTFSIEDFNFSVPGILLDGLLPDGEPFEVSRGKWKFDKAATVKWAKPKKGVERSDYYDDASGKDLIVDTSKGKTNLSGLKLTYTAKTGQFKGSFKVYALQGTGKKRKLAKYTVNVIGFVVDGVGYGEASCKKPAGTWTVTVE